MSKMVRWLAFLALLLMVFALAGNVNQASAFRYDVQGLVFMDDNLNGIWDVGESGYDGVWMYDEDLKVHRNVGATIMVITPAYDEFELETNSERALEEHETVTCTQQDLVLADGDVNHNAQRPCSGTWAFPVNSRDTYLSIELEAPAGYMITSGNPQFCATGEEEWMDFGLAPIAAAAELETAEAVDEAVAAVEPAYEMEVTGNGYVSGLVFIDDNEDGVWQPGEAGYGGEYAYDDESKMMRYMGAVITLISPAYDDYDVESMGYRELDEHESVACSQQDLVIDGELNPNPLRPCSGTFGMSHAGDDVRWEVSVAVPDGYKLTSANPQYYTTGSGQMPVDFGIAPVAGE